MDTLWFVLAITPMIVICGVWRALGYYEGVSGKKISLGWTLILGVFVAFYIGQYVPWILSDTGYIVGAV